jgi:hypothetical protein
VLHADGYRHFVCDFLLGRDDRLDASQRACDGVPSTVSRPRCWFCCRMDVLVSSYCALVGSAELTKCNRFAYAVIAAEEITAVSNTMDFRYDDDRTFLSWPVGQNIDPAVWITLFLALVIVVNMFPVKVSMLRLQILNIN